MDGFSRIIEASGPISRGVEWSEAIISKIEVALGPSDINDNPTSILCIFSRISGP